MQSIVSRIFLIATLGLYIYVLGSYIALHPDSSNGKGMLVTMQLPVVASVLHSHSPTQSPTHLRKYGWHDCLYRTHLSAAEKDDWLMRLLSSLHEVFRSHDIFHVVAYGTLLGAVRNSDINPYEVDNDIIVNATAFRITPELQHSFLAKKMIIFKDSIYRVCELDPDKAPRPTGWTPWSDRSNRRICLYNDVYPTIMRSTHLVDWVTGHTVGVENWRPDSIKIRNASFPSFARNVSMQLILNRYGARWRLPPSGRLNQHGHEQWKVSLINRIAGK